VENKLKNDLKQEEEKNNSDGHDKGSDQDDDEKKPDPFAKIRMLAIEYCFFKLESPLSQQEIEKKWNGKVSKEKFPPTLNFDEKTLTPLLNSMANQNILEKTDKKDVYEWKKEKLENTLKKIKTLVKNLKKN